MKKNPLLSGILNVLLGTSMLVSLPACTDEEVAATLGAVAIGAGAIAIASAASSDNGSYCSGGSHERCHEFSDRWGHIHRECREVYDNGCDGYHRRHTVSAVGQASVPTTDLLAIQTSQDAQLQIDEVKWAETFKMGYTGSQKLIGALNEAKSGKLQPVLDLGLTKKDVKQLAKLSMPSEDAVQALSASLDQDAPNTRAMLNEILTIAAQNKK